jgi:hypothetical protein
VGPQTTSGFSVVSPPDSRWWLTRARFVVSVSVMAASALPPPSHASEAPTSERAAKRANPRARARVTTRRAATTPCDGRDGWASGDAVSPESVAAAACRLRASRGAGTISDIRRSGDISDPFCFEDSCRYRAARNATLAFYAHAITMRASERNRTPDPCISSTLPFLVYWIRNGVRERVADPTQRQCPRT